MPNGIPSHDTFSRIFAKLDPAALLICLQKWLNDLREILGGKHVAIDGKTLRGWHNGDARPNAVHLVSAWATENAGSSSGSSRSTRNPMKSPPFHSCWNCSNIEGDTVTIDALGCQKEIAKTIVDKKANSLLQVKDNQPTLCEAISEAFITLRGRRLPPNRRCDVCGPSTATTGVRRPDCLVANLPADLPGADDWTGLKSIGMVLRTRKQGDTMSEEVAFLHHQPRSEGQGLRRHHAWPLEH